MAEEKQSLQDQVNSLQKKVNKEKNATTPGFSELGYSGLNRYGGHINEEFLSSLQGDKGIQVYEEMTKNDAVISAFLFAIRQLVRQVDWRIEQQDNTPQDREAAEFLNQVLFEDLDQSWDDVMDEALSFLQFGFSVLEIVFKRRDGEDSKFNDGKVGLRSFEIRGQETIEKWDFTQHGKVEGVYQQGPPDYEEVYIPEEKLLHLTTSSHKNNPRGKSILRSAYRSWKIKKSIEEIEATGVEKDLVGIPTLKPPEGLDIWDSSDPQMQGLKNDAEELVQNLRRDEQEGVVLPFGWELDLLGSAGSRQFNTDKIIKRYDQRIAMSTLADFLVLGQNEQGSYAMNISKQRLFQQALDGWVSGIADAMNKQVVDRLFEINDYDIEEPPRLKTSSIESPPLDELSQFIKNLAGAGAPLFPDEELENHLRERADLPVKKKEGDNATAPDNIDEDE